MVTRFAVSTCREAVRAGVAAADFDDDCGIDTVIDGDGTDGFAVDLDIDASAQMRLDIDLTRAG